jgi:hypothetical protein
MPLRRLDVGAMRLLLALGFLGLIGAPVRAAIGDDITVLYQTYGSAQDLGAGVLLFRYKENYEITVYLVQRHSSMEIIGRKKDLNGENPPLSDTEIQDFLALQKGSMAWIPMKSQNANKQAWRRTDNLVFANYSPKAGLLTFLNPLEQGNNNTTEIKPPAKN